MTITQTLKILTISTALTFAGISVAHAGHHETKNPKGKAMEKAHQHADEAMSEKADAMMKKEEVMAKKEKVMSQHDDAMESHGQDMDGTAHGMMKKEEAMAKKDHTMDQNDHGMMTKEDATMKSMDHRQDEAAHAKAPGQMKKMNFDEALSHCLANEQAALQACIDRNTGQRPVN